MGGKKKYIEMFSSFAEPFICSSCHSLVRARLGFKNNWTGGPVLVHIMNLDFTKE